jgi:hypothetical protein
MNVPEMLVRSGGYRDLEAPVIVTSGEFLTPFFVNAERLCGDPGIDAYLTAHGDSDAQIIDYSCSRERADAGFAEVVGQIAGVVRAILGSAREPVVSGGQRRDWLFSGPVARRLGLRHLSLFKQSPGQDVELDRVVLRSSDGRELRCGSLAGCTVIHVVDMVTAASSCYSRDQLTGRDVGWIPMVRARGGQISDLVAVVSRRQGGEEALGRVGVKVRSLAVVDEQFLASHSRAPAEAVAYYHDPGAWTRRYLQEHGIGILLGYLVDDAKKLPRLRKFLAAYRSSLESLGLWAELEGAARTRLGRSASELAGGSS